MTLAIWVKLIHLLESEVTYMRLKSKRPIEK